MPMRPCFTVSMGLVSSCTAGTMRSCCSRPRRSICMLSGSPALARIFSCSVLQPSTGSPSMARILSPYCSPGCAAGDCGFRCPTSWKKTTTLITSAKEKSVNPADWTNAPIWSPASLNGHGAARHQPSGEQPCQQEHKRRVEEQGVDAVEEPAVSGEQAPAVLGAEGALEHRLGEIAQRAEHRRAGADQRRAPRLQPRQPEMLHDQRAEDRSGRAADGAFPGLAG